MVTGTIGGNHASIFGKVALHSSIVVEASINVKSITMAFEVELPTSLDLLSF